MADAQDSKQKDSRRPAPGGFISIKSMRPPELTAIRERVGAQTMAMFRRAPEKGGPGGTR